MLIDNKVYEITARFNINININNILNIKLIGIDNITNMSCIFYGCSSLLFLLDISN